MEGDNVDMEASGGGPANSRWNPTKEQISMLESLYGEGMRTPSADQIQQITSRLKAYGHIEGKNVFYWFQNHKARQRQKQKQESMAYINCYLHNKSHQPLIAPPSPNVVCGPYYLPQNELGFYPQYCKSRVQIPSTLKRRSRTEKVDKTRAFHGTTNEPHEDKNGMLQKSNGILDIDKGNSNQETLPLFPLHPTGILQERASLSTIYSTCDEESNSSPGFPGNAGAIVEGSCDKPLFDFFSGRGPYESY